MSQARRDQQEWAKGWIFWIVVIAVSVIKAIGVIASTRVRIARSPQQPADGSQATHTPRSLDNTDPMHVKDANTFEEADALEDADTKEIRIRDGDLPDGQRQDESLGIIKSILRDPNWRDTGQGNRYVRRSGRTYVLTPDRTLKVKDSKDRWWSKGLTDHWWLRLREDIIRKDDTENTTRLDGAGNVWFKVGADEDWIQLSPDQMDPSDMQRETDEARKMVTSCVEGMMGADGMPRSVT